MSVIIIGLDHDYDTDFRPLWVENVSFAVDYPISNYSLPSHLLVCYLQKMTRFCGRALKFCVLNQVCVKCLGAIFSPLGSRRALSVESGY